MALFPGRLHKKNINFAPLVQAKALYSHNKQEVDLLLVS